MFRSPITLSNKSLMIVEVLAPDLFRIRMDATGKFSPGGVERYQMLNLDWPDCTVQEQKGGKDILFKTEQAELRVDCTDGNFCLCGADGRELLRTAAPPNGSQDSGFNLRLKLQADERLYGLGDESRSELNKRGHDKIMSITNVSAYTPIPFFSSSRGWGLYLNTTWIHRFDGGKKNPEVLQLYSQKGMLECFLFAANSIPDVLNRYTELTGRSYVLPRWSYGMTFVCDEREVRARDILYEALEFRRQGIPCDVIGLEPGWMEKRYDFSTEKQWSETRFHIPFWLKNKPYGTFCHALHNMGFKLSLWLCCDYDLSEFEELQLKNQGAADSLSPSVDAESNLEDDLIKDPHFHPSRQDTLTKPGEGWFEHLKKFVDDGADAFKLDGSNQINYHPDRKWLNGMDDAEMHNLYPLLLAKQMCQGFTEYTGGKRTQIFTPSGHAGIQKYAAIWAGDTGGGPNTIPALLNLSMSGQSNVCTDMQVHDAAGIHYGFLQALAEGFSWHMYNQPWFLKPECLALYKYYAHLRYSLLPYIYTMAHIAYRSGMPIMRAMPLVCPELPEADDCLQQYFFGDSLLVSAFADKVLLPAGAWYDFWTDRLQQGGSWIPAEFPADRGGCLLVKAGSVIPRQSPVESAGTKLPELLTWHIYPGEDFDFTLIEDDGISLAYQKGEVVETEVRGRRSGNRYMVEISPRKGTCQGMPALRKHRFVVHPAGLKLEVPADEQNESAMATVILTD